MLTPDIAEEFLRVIYRVQEEQRSRPIRWASAVFRSPLVAFGASSYLLRIPSQPVTMSSRERSNALWLYDPKHPWRVRGFASSYLELPENLEDYWKGPEKQELRRRTSQARAAGFVTLVASREEIVPLIARVYRADVDGRVAEIEENIDKMRLTKGGSPLDTAVCVGVYDPQGEPVAFSLGTQVGNAVNTMLSGTVMRGTTRWLCFSAFVEEVYARGGRFIIQPPPWALSSGNRIFSGHLGFEPGRIRSPRGQYSPRSDAALSTLKHQIP